MIVGTAVEESLLFLELHRRNLHALRMRLVSSAWDKVRVFVGRADPAQFRCSKREGLLGDCVVISDTDRSLGFVLIAWRNISKARALREEREGKKNNNKVEAHPFLRHTISSNAVCYQ